MSRDRIWFAMCFQQSQYKQCTQCLKEYMFNRAEFVRCFVLHNLPTQKLLCGRNQLQIFRTNGEN